MQPQNPPRLHVVHACHVLCHDGSQAVDKQQVQQSSEGVRCVLSSLKIIHCDWGVLERQHSSSTVLLKKPSSKLALVMALHLHAVKKYVSLEISTHLQLLH
jgi:hypothetical protein